MVGELTPNAIILSNIPSTASVFPLATVDGIAKLQMFA